LCKKDRWFFWGYSEKPNYKYQKTLKEPIGYGIREDCEGNSLIGIADIIVAKNRNEVTGEVRLHFDCGIPKFRCLKNDFT